MEYANKYSGYWHDTRDLFEKSPEIAEEMRKYMTGKLQRELELAQAAEREGAARSRLQRAVSSKADQSKVERKAGTGFEPVPRPVKDVQSYLALLQIHNAPWQVYQAMLDRIATELTREKEQSDLRKEAIETLKETSKTAGSNDPQNRRATVAVMVVADKPNTYKDEMSFIETVREAASGLRLTANELRGKAKFAKEAAAKQSYACKAESLYSEAIATLSTHDSEELNRDRALTYYGRAEARHMLDNTVGALEDALTAYEYNKESVAAVYRVVEYATELKDYTVAVKCVKEAITHPTLSQKRDVREALTNKLRELTSLLLQQQSTESKVAAASAALHAALQGDGVQGVDTQGITDATQTPFNVLSVALEALNSLTM